jgi:hypothetical protein
MADGENVTEARKSYRSVEYADTITIVVVVLVAAWAQDWVVFKARWWGLISDR